VKGLTLRCQAVLFDLDGVLIDSRAVVERTWEHWQRKHGLTHIDIVARAHGRRSIETVREVAPQLDATAEVRWLESAELNDVEGLVALAGAVRLFDAIPATRRAVVTSGGRRLATLRLRKGGLAVPPVLIAAEDVANGKPAPDGYLLAAARVGVDPRECVVIEDTPAGIAAARAAEARVLAVATTFAADRLAAADVTVSSLDAVRVSIEDGGAIGLQIEL